MMTSGSRPADPGQVRIRTDAPGERATSVKVDADQCHPADRPGCRPGCHHQRQRGRTTAGKEEPATEEPEEELPDQEAPPEATQLPAEPETGEQG